MRGVVSPSWLTVVTATARRVGKHRGSEMVGMDCGNAVTVGTRSGIRCTSATICTLTRGATLQDPGSGRDGNATRIASHNALVSVTKNPETRRCLSDVSVDVLAAAISIAGTGTAACKLLSLSIRMRWECGPCTRASGHRGGLRLHKRCRFKSSDAQTPGPGEGY